MKCGRVNDKDDREGGLKGSRDSRIHRRNHYKYSNDNDDSDGVPTTTTTPGRREEESRESKRNFSHGRRPLSCREGAHRGDDDERRKRALFNAPRKNRPREETEDADGGDGSEEDSTPPFE